MPFANLPQRWIGQYEAEVPIVGNWRRLLGQSENPVPAVPHHRYDETDNRHSLIKTSIIISKLERTFPK